MSSMMYEDKESGVAVSLRDVLLLVRRFIPLLDSADAPGLQEQLIGSVGHAIEIAGEDAEAGVSHRLRAALSNLSTVAEDWAMDQDRPLSELEREIIQCMAGLWALAERESLVNAEPRARALVAGRGRG